MRRLTPALFARNSSRQRPPSPAPIKKKYGQYAIFGFPRLGFILVRPPRRTYGYGAVLGTYLSALAYARDRHLAVCFLVRRNEPAASLGLLASRNVLVIPPVFPVRVVMWSLWSLRIVWAHIRSPGRWTRLRAIGLASATVVIARLIRVVRDLERWLKRTATHVKRAIKESPRPQPLHLRPIGGWTETGWPPVGATVNAGQEQRCRSLASSLGLDIDRPMVALHIREAGWRSSLYENGERPMDEVRNADPETYRASLDHLREQGFQVVRLGDASMSPPPAEGIVDAARCPETDPLFELWVVGKSRFMIGSDSGPVALAALAGTPLLLVNTVHLTWGLRRPTDRFICKIAYALGTREPMTLTEMVAGGFVSCEVAPTIGQMDDPYRSNTPEEILAAVEEMIAVVGRAPEQLAATPAQLAYEALFDERLLPPASQRGRICDGFARTWLRGAHELAPTNSLVETGGRPTP